MNRTSLAVLAGLFFASAAQAQSSVFLDKSVDQWANELNNAKPQVRRSAAFALGRIGYNAWPRCPDLVTRLESDSDASVRDMAAASLGDIMKALSGGNMEAWKKCSPALSKALDDADARVRRSAAYALGAFGQSDEQFPGAFRNALQDKKDETTHRDAVAIRDALRAALKDKEASVRQNAAWALGQLHEEAGSAADALRECLSDKNALVRRDAATSLGFLGKAAAAAVPSLMEMVKSEPDTVVRKAALGSLVPLVGPDHRRYARFLQPLLQDKDPEVAVDSAVVLAKIGGEEAKEAVPVLRKALKDADAEVQEKSVIALSEMGPQAKDAIFDLAEVLRRGKVTKVRCGAALALAHIRAAAEPVALDIAEVLKPTEPVDVRQDAAEALARMQYPANKKALPAILQTIAQDLNPLVRQKCVWSLFEMKEPEDFKRCGAQEMLTKLLDDTNKTMNLVRYDAARKLANILREDAPPKTADVLLEMLKNTDLRVYNSTDAKVQATGNEASGGKVNIQADLGGDARYMAVEGLGCLGATARKRPDVVSALKDAAKSNDAKLRQTALQALKELDIK